MHNIYYYYYVPIYANLNIKQKYVWEIELKSADRSSFDFVGSDHYSIYYKRWHETI